MPNREERDNDDVAVIISQEFLFFWIFILIIFSWILIDLWGRWINNFTFVTLGLDEKSPYHTFIIALAVTLIVFAAVIFLKNENCDLEPEICAAYHPNRRNQQRELEDESPFRPVNTFGLFHIF